ncbi:hypothetical protein [Streptosporangium sp. NBC_01756]|uniref:hypothetical protein n=1 Tax=Streptosporangium sp. NBC_01756 TaxID=2975950 RepID=UPI002DDAFB93|nr:hypothetical protein [Streptosporangium sp. NBC_01756]WSC83485.1 hypothetical protein OIE48_24085 [Streptosporangium sp. NBC_01756]
MAVNAARPSRPLRIAGPALGVLIAALLAAAVWIGGDLRDAQAAADDRRAAVQAAGVHAVALLSVNHHSADADLKRVLDTSTGAARVAYARSLGTLKADAIKNKALRTGALRASGIVSLTGNTARVMVVGDVVTRQDGSKKAPHEQFSRWNMEVTRVGGIWLVSKAELV